MRAPRRLSLRRETLTALTDGDLAAVAGGSHLCTGGPGTSIDAPCPTLPLSPCLSLNSCDVELTWGCR